MLCGLKLCVAARTVALRVDVVVVDSGTERARIIAVNNDLLQRLR